MSNTQLHIAVIGAGSGGYTAAFLAAGAGAKVTLIDKNGYLGGTCLHKGCIPSKSLLHIVQILRDAEEAEKLGITFSEPQINLARVREWKDSVIQKINAGLVHVCKARGVEFIHAEAQFTDSKTLNLTKPDGTTESRGFDKIILSSGSEPGLSGILPKGKRIMTSTEALALEEIPSSLLVVGGGYIGLELGTVYAGLGSKVTVVEMTGQLLNGVDRDLVRVLERRLKKTFEAVKLNTQIIHAEETDDGVRVKYEDHKKNVTEQTFDKVLVCTGRKPVFDALRLENTGITVNGNGFIDVNKNGLTKDPNIYALGDITGVPLLAHNASKQAHVAVAALTGNPFERTQAFIPGVVYTDPEIAVCGLTETQAQEKGMTVAVEKTNWMTSGRAASLNKTDGLTKLIIDPATRKLLGIGIVGVGAGELIAEGALALEMNASVCDLVRTVHPHPSLNETVMEAALSFYGQNPHSIKK